MLYGALCEANDVLVYKCVKVSDVCPSAFNSSSVQLAMYIYVPTNWL